MIEASSYRPLGEVDWSKYDAFLFSVGAEVRSVQLFKLLRNSDVKTAAYMHDHHSLLDTIGAEGAFHRDIDLKITSGSLFLEGQHVAYRKFLRNAKSILVDVSSMTRSMMAEQVLYLSEYGQSGLKVDFAYLPTVYSQPVHEYPKIRSIGAAAPQFSGFDFRPGDPVALVLGLGHEYGVSIGLMNQMEPKMAVAFRSVGIDERFEKAVSDANFDFDFSPYSVSVIDVDITKPKKCFSIVETVLSNMIVDHRVVAIPSGPKIFALINILAALKHLGKVAIFRVEHAVRLSEGHESTHIIQFSMSDSFKADLDRSELLAP